MTAGVRRCILLSALLLVCYQQWIRADLPAADERLVWHQLILEKRADAPFLQRIFVTWGVDKVARLFPDYDRAVITLYSAVGLLATALTLWGADTFLRRLFEDRTALIGTLLFGLTYNSTLHFCCNTPPYSYVENALFAWALVLLHIMWVTGRSSFSLR